MTLEELDMLIAAAHNAANAAATVHYEPGNSVHTIPCTSSGIAIEVAQNIAVKLNPSRQDQAARKEP